MLHLKWSCSALSGPITELYEFIWKSFRKYIVEPFQFGEWPQLFCHTSGISSCLNWITVMHPIRPLLPLNVWILIYALQKIVLNIANYDILFRQDTNQEYWEFFYFLIVLNPKKWKTLPLYHSRAFPDRSISLIR